MTTKKFLRESTGNEYEVKITSFLPLTGTYIRVSSDIDSEVLYWKFENDKVYWNTDERVSGFRELLQPSDFAKLMKQCVLELIVENPIEPIDKIMLQMGYEPKV